MWWNQIGIILKIDIFREAITFKLRYRLNSENSYSSVFVSWISYYFFRTCVDVWFIICRLLKSVSFLTVPFWLPFTVQAALAHWKVKLKETAFFSLKFLVISYSVLPFKKGMKKLIVLPTNKKICYLKKRYIFQIQLSVFSCLLMKWIKR